MRMQKIDTRQFVLEVLHTNEDVKSFRHYTAKAARHEAKRLAGAKDVASIWLMNWTENTRECLWMAAS